MIKIIKGYIACNVHNNTATSGRDKDATTLYPITIDKGIIDDYTGNLKYISFIMSSKAYKNFTKWKGYRISSEKSNYYSKTFFINDKKYYNINTYKLDDNVHVVMTPNEIIRKMLDGNNVREGRHILNIICDNENELSYEIWSNTGNTEGHLTPNIYNKIYNYIVKNTGVPFLEEWTIPVINEMFRTRRLVPLQDKELMEDYDVKDYILTISDTENINYGFHHILTLRMTERDIISTVEECLKEHVISIDGCTTISDNFSDVNNLDDYLEYFSQSLIDKIVDKFNPKFIPEKENISEEVKYYSGIASTHSDVVPYEAQENVIEAATRNLDINPYTIISAEMGSGKTQMAAATIDCHARKHNHKDYSCIIMCPGTMPTNWNEAINTLIPFSETYYIETLSDLFKIKERINDKNRKRPLFGIITYGSAKSDFDVRPAVTWNNRHHCFVCPKCGKPILFDRKYDNFGHKNFHCTEDLTKSNDLDFLKQTDDNCYCANTTVKVDPITGATTVETCGASLWTIANKNNLNGWVKVNKLGWIKSDRAETIRQHIETSMQGFDPQTIPTFRKQYTTYLNSIVDAQTNGISMKVINKYSIARYIHKHMKRMFDYAIADEVHQLSGDSAQGEAFGNIFKSVWKGVALTGTLSNGYASGLFHLLFRTNTKRMIDNGFEYNKMSEFVDKYGTTESTRTSTGHWRNVHNRSRNNNSNNNNSDEVVDRTYIERTYKTKKKPVAGISPMVFSDYLLNNTAFLFQKDITKDLVQYTEIPTPIEMDKELEDAYTAMFEAVVNEIKVNHNSVKEAINYLTMSLDQPYGLDVLMNTKNDIISQPMALDDTVIRPKERALIDLVLNKKEKGEKVLIYTHWTNKLDIQNRLKDLLEDEGIKVDIMSNVEQKKRQDWLNKKAKDIDALILNPKLVEVGLNLLDYTTIVFYEIGNQLSVIRQSSRRSWRLNQEHPVEVYFMYYEGTVQEQLLGVISSKLKAARALEGDFNCEGLSEMSSDNDVMTAIANSIANDTMIEVKKDNFEAIGSEDSIANRHERLKNIVKINLNSTAINYTTPSRIAMSIQADMKKSKRKNVVTFDNLDMFSIA